MFGGNYGFFGGGVGGSSAAIVDIQQYTVSQSVGVPQPGATSFTFPTGLVGTNVTVFVNGYGYLVPTVQFSYTTSASGVTGITLLTGLQFQEGEFWTFTGFVEP